MSELKRCTCKEHDGPNPLPVTEFYRDKYQPDGLSHRCRECDKARNSRYRAGHPEYHRKDNRASVRRHNRYNAASLDGATHRREPWTIPQLEIAARKDLTARQAAAMTGRTFSAVKNIRRKMKDDGHMDLNQLQQALIKNLASVATGQGGNFDVFTAELNKELAQDYLTDTAEPVLIPADLPDSDEPDPAGQDS